MKARDIIYDRFFRPFEGKLTAARVGVELEFPLINMAGGDIDKDYAAGIMDHFLAMGWKVALEGTGGEPLFVENGRGDCLSFDNSYNNFEFSLNHSDDLTDLEGRFREYLGQVQEYFRRGGLELAGRGTNPNQPGLSVFHVPFSTYNMVSEYLHSGRGEHCIPDFPAFLSSVQTHLDVNIERLPEAYTLFARLDFLRALLFANSPDWEGKGYRLYRDYLWEKSAFGACPNITGKVDGRFESVDDLVDYFLQKGMFNRIRDGKYETFAPVSIREYFEDPAYGAKPEDIGCYLSFKSVELTCRGTLEVRGDCAQPFDRAFAPPAFNLGILCAMDRAAELTEEFFRSNNITASNTELRNIVCEGRSLELIAPADRLSQFASDMLELAESALKARGKGEERLLEKNIDISRIKR